MGRRVCPICYDERPKGGCVIGRTLGHYRIDAELGRGGMGVVYRAWDTHLDRPVAVKVLAAEAVANPERKRRFVQEAKAASALNHPNIIVVHDISQDQGVDFIAMEFVAGRTVGELIPGRGLPLADALTYAIQIADALAAAHAAGIVHRDLKPANVMVNERGLVKVLDFGLAKLADRGEDDSLEPTRTAGPTKEGVILGTAAYMSPEQAEGRKLDARSDVFSFGAVLFEMVTGRRAFTGDTSLSVMAAVLREEPKLPPEAPSEVAAIVNRCLRKDPARRYQDMADLKITLEDAREAAPAAKAPGRRAVPAWVAVAALLLAAALGGLFLWRRTPGAPDPQMSFTPLTDQAGQEMQPSLSPDGRSFAYASRAAGNWDLYSQRVEGKNPINLTKDSPADDTQPAFSPDGERLAFRSEREGGGIFLMGATGESVRRLTDAGYSPAWSPDGKEIAFSAAGFDRPDNRGADGDLWSVNVATGEKRLLAKGDAVQPHWSPRGHRIAYWSVGKGAHRDIWTVAAKGGGPVAVTNDQHLDWNPVWSPDGKYLHFASDRGGSMNLWRVPIEETTGQTLGPPEPVTTPSPYSGHISISRDGRRLAYVNQVSTFNIQKVAFDPVKEVVSGQPVWVTQGSMQIGFPDSSPDGEWLACASMGRQQDLALIRPDGTGLRRLTDDLHRDRLPRWSPDGKRLAFYSNRTGGRWEIWTIRPDGSGLEQLTTTTGRGAHGPVWSPDGARLSYSLQETGSYLVEIGLIEVGKAPQALAPPQEGGPFFSRSWSADGRFLAGEASRGVLLYDLESRQYQRLTDSGGSPVWLGDSRRVLFVRGNQVLLIDRESKRMRVLLSAGSGAIVAGGLAVSRDGGTIYLTVQVTESDVWLASRP